jgi:hypothetical protein
MAILQSESKHRNNIVYYLHCEYFDALFDQSHSFLSVSLVKKNFVFATGTGFKLLYGTNNSPVTNETKSSRRYLPF